MNLNKCWSEEFSDRTFSRLTLVMSSTPYTKTNLLQISWTLSNSDSDWRSWSSDNVGPSTNAVLTELRVPETRSKVVGFNIGKTYKWKVSLNLGDQLLFLDLVWNLRFLSLSWGPIMVISTKGLNIPDVCHFKSLAPMTVGVSGESGSRRGRQRRSQRRNMKHHGRRLITVNRQTDLWPWPFSLCSQEERTSPTERTPPRSASPILNLWFDIKTSGRVSATRKVIKKQLWKIRRRGEEGEGEWGVTEPQGWNMWWL